MRIKNLLQPADDFNQNNEAIPLSMPMKALVDQTNDQHSEAAPSHQLFAFPGEQSNMSETDLSTVLNILSEDSRGLNTGNEGSPASAYSWRFEYR